LTGGDSGVVVADVEDTPVFVTVAAEEETVDEEPEDEDVVEEDDRDVDEEVEDVVEDVVEVDVGDPVFLAVDVDGVVV